mgnify:CR=1 FL=1
MNKKRLAIILGIRPDVIRASLILNSIRTSKEFDVKFIWSGQHYSDNLKDVFFRELNVKPLNAGRPQVFISNSCLLARIFHWLEMLLPILVIVSQDFSLSMSSSRGRLCYVYVQDKLTTPP